MLQIVVPASELFDESTMRFISAKAQVLQLEHSLVSISKWESKWEKPFLSKKDLTSEETLDYIRCMTLTQNVSPSVYRRLTPKQIDDIFAYIGRRMSATWFVEDKNAPKNREVITSEIIYYWMIALNIPMECQKWHLNRLLTLIRVCSIKSKPPKKMKGSELAKHNHNLNASRRHRLGTKG